MVARTGLLATLNCEFRQAWKGAAAAVDMCARLSMVRVTAHIKSTSLASICREQFLMYYDYLINNNFNKDSILL
tara:strand:+ start:194 stop:415 length:222 start_codon:yes stop_codon:yes gene_type:complete